MNLIRLAIERPVAVMSLVLMVVLAGLVALASIPIQLTPDVRRPIIVVQTSWSGAAPVEVEREILNRQEEVLRGLEGVIEMSASAQTGRARVRLEFDINQDMDRALLLVANRLDRVQRYPEEVDEPTLRTSSSEDNPIAWFRIMLNEGNERDIQTYGDLINDVVQDRLERIRGISRVNVWGGTERELRVAVAPEKLARYGLTVSEVLEKLRSANASISAGAVDEGKRRYVVRTEGEFSTPDRVRRVMLRSEEDPTTGGVARVTLDDVAAVSFGYKEPHAQIRNNGRPANALSIVREAGTNVIEVMRDVRRAVKELNEGPLAQSGITVRQIYDETDYINSAIDLVQQNIFLGGGLAALVLLVFLRSLRATLVVSLAIPTSVIGAFVAMALLGRSINVISLAGIAFSVGMVVDAAIVVLENIHRLRERGYPARRAALVGVQQVWGAVLVSALTTVLVFVPILVMRLEVGQLFRDIAVAISVAVLFSLVVSGTVIPSLANRLFGGDRSKSVTRLRLPLVDRGADLFIALVMSYTRRVVKSPALALGSVAVICGSAALATVLWLPKLEYLPDGNRNLVFGAIQPPPGYNLATTTRIAEGVEAAVRPYLVKDASERPANETGPRMDNFWFIAVRGMTYVGASSADPGRAGELIPILQKPIFAEPGTFGFITQRSLFGRGLGGSKRIQLNISGPTLEGALEVARRAATRIEEVLPRREGNQLRPRPGLELGAPEIRVIPDPVRLADNGIFARELGLTIDVFNDGIRVAEVTVAGERVDLTLGGPKRLIGQTQGIGNLPVVTRPGKILPVSSLADIKITSGPIEIRHLERERTVTLDVRPANTIALETAMKIIQREVIDTLRAEGLPPGVRMHMSGTADKLTQTWNAMIFDLILAVVIVYLVMAVLLESFLYPAIICLSVPLATAGGVGGLAVLNLFTYQALDMLTLLGFVILIGIVVNNAILLVHQTLFQMRVEDKEVSEAILIATRNRIRPIFMSTLTSICGMMPLVVSPGAGSELYRGLGSVVVGGLSLSAALTLLIIPPLMTLVVGTVDGARKAAAVPTEAPAE